MLRRYFDHNATAPRDPDVARAMAAAAARLWGNPSSVHAEGRAARDAVEAARRQVARLLGAVADQIVFTSGGTEADQLGVLGLARRKRDAGSPPVVVTSALEHPAVRGATAELAARGYEIREVAPSSSGHLVPDRVAEVIAGGACLVTVQLANHELGTLQDVAAIARVARAAGAAVHCDAVQAAGRIPIDVRALGVDALVVSAHKLGGPKGAGALWLASGDLDPVLAGGHQERGRRPGTENVLGIVGFGVAAARALEHRLPGAAAVARLAEELEAGLLELGATIHGAGGRRVGNTVNAAFEGAPGEVVVTALDLEGFAASTGAACTSGTVEPSPVLLALGLPDERAAESIRFSLGPENTAEEVRALLEVLPPILVRARQFG